jgi:mRNA interferase MazF
VEPYTPQRGDLVWLRFLSPAGGETGGRQPVLVLSPMRYNGKVGLMVACPIASPARGYPFEVDIPRGAGVSGAILSDQVRSLDWRERQAEFAGRVGARTLDEVRSRLDAVLHDEG